MALAIRGDMRAGSEDREARREFQDIGAAFEGALRRASERFGAVARSVVHLRFASADLEAALWRAIDEAVAVAGRFQQCAGHRGLSWVRDEDLGRVSQILHSGGPALSDEQRARMGEPLGELWDAWSVALAPAPRPPEVRAFNLHNVAARALSGVKQGSGAAQNLFDELAGCLGEYLGLPSFLVRGRALGATPVLVSSLIDPTLAAAWVIKEASAELVGSRGELEGLPATLQALCLSRLGVLANGHVVSLAFSECPDLVGLHQGWRRLAHVIADPRDRAPHADDLQGASPEARARFGVYVLSGEIEGTVERLLADAPGTPAARRSAWWWICRFTRHYAGASGARAERLAWAEKLTRAELRSLIS
jgi:hypothetical protein